MATTIHVPTHLLRRLDARAKVLRVSRNRLIVEAIEQSLGGEDAWAAEFVVALGQPLEAETAGTLDRSLAEVRRRRAHRKAGPTL